MPSNLKLLNTYRKDTISQKGMVMVKAVVVNNRIMDQSLVQAGAEASQLENLSVPTVAKFMLNGMIAQPENQRVMDVTRRDILRQCAIHPGRLHSHDHPHRLNVRLYKRCKPRMTRTLVKQRMLT